MQKAPLSQNRFRLVFISWWLIWTCLQVIIFIGLGLPLNQSLADGTISNILLAGGCLLVSNNLRFYLPQQQRYSYLFILSLVISGLWLALSRWLILLILPHDAGYHMFIERSLAVRFGIGFLLIACMAMISVVWYTLADQEEHEKRQAEQDKLTREAELYKLRQQLQPHFLFNSLNSISALVGGNPVQARTMIQQLSDFLRKTLKKEEEQQVTLDEELEYLDLYLSIEKVRFGHRLVTDIQCDDTSRLQKIPTMLLQPIVENAIKFGLYDTTGDITIRICAETREQFLVISVTNPFDPETSLSATGTGFGLKSVQRRLHLLFARTDLLSTAMLDDIFTTTVKIPQ